jgi:hypothetical protein
MAAFISLMVERRIETGPGQVFSLFIFITIFGLWNSIAIPKGNDKSNKKSAGLE